ncbi:hypothetical protein ACGF3G_09270 [Streptomyces sp. NPDC048179]|uniref:hypothetical protein n=1 Tax=Streptomyces sp. NPDC048179 TaxID=3365506 RepID=UPI0037145E70
MSALCACATFDRVVFTVRAEQPTLPRSALTSATTRATTPDAVPVVFGVLDALGVLDGFGAAEEAAAVVVLRALGDAVALGFGAVVFLALAGACGVFFLALGVFVALGAFVALGVADAVDEGSPVWAASQGRPQLASFHQPFLFHEAFVALFSALSDRPSPLPGQLVQAMAADGMPTAPTATAAMTIRR